MSRSLMALNRLWRMTFCFQSHGGLQKSGVGRRRTGGTSMFLRVMRRSLCWKLLQEDGRITASTLWLTPVWQSVLWRRADLRRELCKRYAEGQRQFNYQVGSTHLGASPLPATTLQTARHVTWTFLHFAAASPTSFPLTRFEASRSPSYHVLVPIG